MNCKVCREPIMLTDQYVDFITCPNCRSRLKIQREPGIVYFEVHSRSERWESETARFERELNKTKNTVYALAVILSVLIVLILLMAWFAYDRPGLIRAFFDWFGEGLEDVISRIRYGAGSMNWLSPFAFLLVSTVPFWEVEK